MADLPRLTLCDQMLANGLFALTVGIYERGYEEMIIAEIAAALPRCSDDHPKVAPLINLAFRITAAAAKPEPFRASEMRGALSDARLEMKQFALWRMSLAQEAMHKMKAAA